MSGYQGPVDPERARQAQAFKSSFEAVVQNVGKVIKGMDVIDKIGQVEVEAPASRPKTPVKIESIRELKAE